MEAWSLVALATVIGSFLGTIVDRMPAGRSIGWSRSRCDACGVMLSARDLVPLVSWVIARGRCRHCGSRLSWFYPAIECAALAIAVLAMAIDGMPRAWLDCLLGWWLLALSWIDLRDRVLPDRLTLPLIVVGLVAAAVFDTDHLVDRVLGAIIGFLALSAIASVYRWVRGHEGMGGGDAKLLAASGAWSGVAALPQIVLAAALAALAAAALLSLGGARLNRHSALPFGPFISLATWAAWLSGPAVFR